MPSEVKRAVWRRDAGRFHHVQPLAKQGPATVENISLRCRRHNQYEAELIFGPHGASTAGEVRTAYGPISPNDCVW